MVGDETSDVAMDDTARLVHEEAKKKEGHFDRQTAEQSEQFSSGCSSPKRLTTGCVRVSGIDALQDPPTKSEESIKMSYGSHHAFADTGALKDWTGLDEDSSRHPFGQIRR